MVILRSMMQLPLLTIAVMLVNVAAGVTGTPVVVEVIAEVAILDTVSPTSGATRGCASQPPRGWAEGRCA
jgi:hypothetical protein